MTSVPGKPADGAAGNTPQGPRRVRASDADRAAVVRRLQDAVGRGLLTFDEGGERIAAAFAARYLDELRPLSGDLPEPVPADPPAVGWQRLGQLLLAQLRVELRTTAAAGIRSRRFVTAVVATLLVVTMVLTVLGAVMHGLADGGPDRMFGDHVFGPRGDGGAGPGPV